MLLKSNFKKRIIAWTPVRRVVNQSKRSYIRGFEGFSLYDVATTFKQQSERHSMLERAAAISFNVFMAIPPTLLFIFTLIPYLPISESFIRELYGLIRDVVPGRENNAVISEFLEDFLKNPRNELLSFGLFLSLFFSSNAMMGILRSFDKNYEGFLKRSGFAKRSTALKLTLMVFTLVFLCLLLLIAQGVVLHWIGIRSSALKLVITNARWIIIIGIIFFIVSFIYRHGPATDRKWPFITTGSVFSTSLMIIATALVSYWVNNFSNYNKLYGSISAVFILMSLIFINALVVFMGFELNVTIASLKRKARAGKAADLPLKN